MGGLLSGQPSWIPTGFREKSAGFQKRNRLGMGHTYGSGDATSINVYCFQIVLYADFSRWSANMERGVGMRSIQN